MIISLSDLPECLLVVKERAVRELLLPGHDEVALEEDRTHLDHRAGSASSLYNTGSGTG